MSDSQASYGDALSGVKSLESLQWQTEVSHSCHPYSVERRASSRCSESQNGMTCT